MFSEPLPQIKGAQKAPAAEEDEGHSVRATVNKVKMAFRTFHQRHRRAHHFVFADQATGSLPWRIRLSWVAPAMSTLPVNVVLSVWGIPHGGEEG